MALNIFQSCIYYNIKSINNKLVSCKLIKKVKQNILYN